VQEYPHKRVLITGGVRRLGLHIALAFSARNATIGLNYHSSSEKDAQAVRDECFALGAREVYLIKGDVTREAAEITEQFLSSANGIDILVNNAGVFPPRRSIAELEKNALQQTLDLNLLAPFEMSRLVLSHMDSGSAIINLASLGGVQIWKERIDYNISKSALITLTEVLARELAPKGITVNAVAPGAIQVENETVERMGVAPSKIPLQRYGKPEDIAKAVLFFAYDAPYVTGQTLIVDGGRSVIG